MGARAFINASSQSVSLRLPLATYSGLPYTVSLAQQRDNLDMAENHRHDHEMTRIRKLTGQVRLREEAIENQRMFEYEQRRSRNRNRAPPVLPPLGFDNPNTSADARIRPEGSVSAGTLDGRRPP